SARTDISPPEQGLEWGRDPAAKTSRGGPLVDPLKNEAADALVLFGMTGDLAHKKIFPALYGLAERNALDVPVVGVASSRLTSAQLRNRIRKSIREAGRTEDSRAL